MCCSPAADGWNPLAVPMVPQSAVPIKRNGQERKNERERDTEYRVTEVKPQGTRDLEREREDLAFIQLHRDATMSCLIRLSRGQWLLPLKTRQKKQGAKCLLSVQIMQSSLIIVNGPDPIPVMGLLHHYVFCETLVE